MSRPTEQAHFDEQAAHFWEADVPERGYEIEMSPGDGAWHATITIEPHHGDLKYVFIQHADDPAVFTPGYTTPGEDFESQRLLATGVYEITDEHIPKWMKAAIRWAGFEYDSGDVEPEESIEELCGPDQTTLAEVEHA